MRDEIDKLRDVLHKEMESEDKDYKEILRLSEELDYLIVEFYKESYESGISQQMSTIFRISIDLF